MKRSCWFVIPLLLSLACTRGLDPSSEPGDGAVSFAFEDVRVQGLVTTKAQGADVQKILSDDGLSAFVLAEEMGGVMPTRASAVLDVSGITSFRVTAYDHSGSFGASTTTLSGGQGFTNTTFTVTNDGSNYWGEPSATKYWPISSRRMSFFSCVPDNAASIPQGTGFPSFSYTVSNTVSNQQDLLVASALDQVNTVTSQGTVGRAPLTFRHALSAVVFAIGDMGVNSASGSLTVTLSGLANQDTYTYSGTSSSSSMGGAWSGSPSGNGTYTFTTSIHGTDASPRDWSTISDSRAMFLMPQTIPDGATLSIRYTDPGGAIHEFSAQLNTLGITDLAPGGLYKYTISLSNKPASLQAAYQPWTDIADGITPVEGPVTTYNSGETFGVYAVDADYKIVFANVPMTASSAGALVPLNTSDHYLSSTYTFYVYYPYQAGLSLTYRATGVALTPGNVIDSSVTGVVGFPNASNFFYNYCTGSQGTTAPAPAVNQSTLANFKASDFQIGRGGYADGNFTVKMNHRTSLSRIVLRSASIAETLTIDARTNVSSVNSYVTTTPGNTFSTASSSVVPYRKGSTNEYYYLAKYNARPLVTDGNTTVDTKWATSSFRLETASAGYLGAGKFREFTITSYLSTRGWLHYIVNYPYNEKKVAMTFVPPVNGVYKFECWGAQGGRHSSEAYLGKGAYTSGNLSVTTSQTFYVYVGEFGGNTVSMYDTMVSTRTWNGGGGGLNNGVVFSDPTKRANHAGGGATDIRTTGGTWSNSTSLESRIMVAGGGGGSSHGGFGGFAGGTTGGRGVRYSEVSGYAYDPANYDMTFAHDSRATGGTQSGGGLAGYFDWTCDPPSNGVKGRGGDGNSMYGGGGGGGYFGGGGAGVYTGSMGGGGGGSSFISGHSGCASVTGYVFSSTSMIGGNQSQTDQNGNSSTGHAGAGYARITFVSE